MNENELYVVKEYKYKNPLITKIDSIIDSCYRDCHRKYLHNFKYECIYEIELTNITNNELNFLTIMGKSMSLYDLRKHLKVARQICFIFKQINKLTIKFYSHLRYINKIDFLKLRILVCHRQFFRKISQNRE